MERFLSRIALALLALCLSAVAMALPRGNPPVTEIKPNLEIYPQVFDIAQDAESRLYLGNMGGVLIHDGESWQLVSLPNKDLARALEFDPASDRVYVGGFNCFGYIDRDASDRPRFHDLTNLFASELKGEEFADIWNVHVDKEGVFFRALRHVFRYRPNVAEGGAQLWRHEGRFGGITRYKDHVILQFRGEGLRRLVDDQWQPIPGTGSLDTLVARFVPLPDGGLLALSSNGLWRRFSDAGVTDFPMPDGMPPASSLSAGIQLEDGSLALTASNGILYLVDPRDSRLHALRLSYGFLSKVIRGVDGSLLVAGPISAFHVRWPTSWTVITSPDGSGGNFYAMAQWGKDWFAMTSDGVKRVGADGRLAPMDWSGNETWDLLSIDADRALLAETYSLLLIEHGKARPLSHNGLYPRTLRRAPGADGIFLIGGESAFGVLREGRDGQWKLLLDSSDTGDASIVEIIADGPHRFWLGTFHNGLMRVELSEDFSQILALVRFGPAEGLEYGAKGIAVPARLPDGRLIVSTTTGFFEFDGKRFHHTDLDGLDALRPADEPLRIAAAADGTLWAYSFSGIFLHDAQGWHEQHIHGLAHGSIESMTFMSSGQALFSAGDGVLRHDPVNEPRLGQPPNVLLAAIEQQDANGEVTALAVRGSHPLTLQSGDWGLTLRFALADLNRPDEVRYQWRLGGLQTRFSDWSANATLNYSRLAPGDYRLELRGRDSEGRVSAIEPLELHVLAPWYARTGMIVAWIVAGLLLAAWLSLQLVHVRTQRLQQAHARLEQVVAERTAELEAANRRLDNMAHVDGLTGIANRRRLDDYLPAAWTNCLERERPLSLLIVDVDAFKKYNDSHGHLAGDALLARLGQTLQTCLRRSEDLLARYGGDEFFVVMPGAEAGQAMEVARHMREQIESSQLGATISIGIASLVPNASTEVTDLIDRADAALYSAKDGGRNRTRAHGET